MLSGLYLQLVPVSKPAGHNTTDRPDCICWTPLLLQEVETHLASQALDVRMADGCDEAHRWGMHRVISSELELDLKYPACIRGALLSEELGMKAAQVPDRRY
eukprot:scaffold15304_cov72-Phaeocystis_antarctica.AAC.2